MDASLPQDYEPPVMELVYTSKNPKEPAWVQKSGTEAKRVD